MNPGTDRSRQPISAVFAFFLGSLGGHAIGCCLAFIVLFFELRTASYNYGYALLMVFSLFGIPIFGLATVIVRHFTQPWTWLSQRGAWLVLLGSLGIILMFWWVTLFLM